MLLLAGNQVPVTDGVWLEGWLCGELGTHFYCFVFDNDMPLQPTSGELTAHSVPNCPLLAGCSGMSGGSSLPELTVVVGLIKVAFRFHNQAIRAEGPLFITTDADRLAGTSGPRVRPA